MKWKEKLKVITKEIIGCIIAVVIFVGIVLLLWGSSVPS